MDPTFAQLASAASRTYGLFRTDQLDELGITRHHVERLVALGLCVREARAVYRMASVPASPEQRILAAVWANAGAVASHRSAAHLWGLPGFATDPPEVTVARVQSRRPAAGTVHGSSALPADHVTVHRLIPVTTPDRTVFDLAGVLPYGRADRMVDVALKRRLCTLATLATVLFVLGRQGRTGTVALRRMLAARGIGYVAPASELERLARRIFRRAGLPEPDFEICLGDGEGQIGRVDCLWRAAKLVVELDGGRFHGDEASRASDRRRDNLMMAAGWRVIRVTWTDLTQNPDQVVALIRRALGLVG